MYPSGKSNIERANPRWLLLTTCLIAFMTLCVKLVGDWRGYTEYISFAVYLQHQWTQGLGKNVLETHFYGDKNPIPVLKTNLKMKIKSLLQNICCVN